LTCLMAKIVQKRQGRITKSYSKLIFAIFLLNQGKASILRNLTGLSTQQHVQDKLIEKAKELLTTTNQSIGEIAYTLRFDYPQSFNKMFKNKRKLTPLAYRQSFN